jgi:hypothetical protein
MELTRQHNHNLVCFVNRGRFIVLILSPALAGQVLRIVFCFSLTGNSVFQFVRIGSLEEITLPQPTFR